MMKSFMLPVILSAVAGVALAQTEAAKPDAMFAVEAATFVEAVTSSNLFEIRSSQLALDKATAAPLKAYATQMIADHEKAAADLAAAAGDIPLPQEPLPKHAGMIAILEGAEGAEFDMLYTEMQTISHLEAVGLVGTYAAGGDDASLQAFAEAKLPTLEMHTAHIKDIASAM